ncbi:MAG: hypothetical protein I3273_05685 [Candidatus Moeniiplasma glomeromycotorum]|nr:hypothetical protein [Candidatus Moeniiplasma glomeromycotorum]MCE8168060.1 hypothetical protein [Candidatus Moeniiplasma glomeromycotorum]MCE8169577.1 hypothetical protein [Candidatus Moeniiplasma glomeromycotorum]
MFISFKNLIKECVHDEKKRFHNRLSQEKLRKIFALLHEKLQDWSSKSFCQIREENKRYCRKLNDGEKWERVEDFAKIKNSYRIKKLILNNELWQLPITEEIRIIGILEEDYINELSLPKKDRESSKDLFSD